MLQSPRGDASSIKMAAARREQRKRRIAGESVDVLQMKMKINRGSRRVRGSVERIEG